MPEPLHGPPVLILGGDEIGLSVARSLGRRGIRITALAPPTEPIRYSRYAEWIRLPGSYWDFWPECIKFLTGSGSDELKGALVLATTDFGLAMLNEHRGELKKKFLLDKSNPEAQRIVLDKIATYEAAREAGIPAPRFWCLKAREDLSAVAKDLVYPLIVKPRFTHLFKPRFAGARYLLAHDFQEAERALEMVTGAGLEAFLVEKIPGPDDRLCSYFTWLDESGKNHFDFTKRIIRRYPKNMGPASYHVTDHVPGIREISLRLFRHIGLQGVANVEYKRDPRDGQYKLIEVNGRFTGSNILVLRSGVNIAEVVYRRATGQKPQEINGFRRGMHMLYPWRDIAAYRELRALGDLDFRQWASSLLHPQTFPIWSWRDPGPGAMPVILSPLHAVKRRLRRRQQRLAAA